MNLDLVVEVRPPRVGETLLGRAFGRFPGGPVVQPEHWMLWSRRAEAR